MEGISFSMRAQRMAAPGVEIPEFGPPRGRPASP
jgi:hypothetical protein